MKLEVEAAHAAVEPGPDKNHAHPFELVWGDEAVTAANAGQARLVAALETRDLKDRAGDQVTSLEKK